MSAHEFTFDSIDHEPLPLKAFQGRPVLLVNTASECGYTPQYARLQRLWERYRDQGLIVLGVPSNDFGAQEPGAEPQIKTFCVSRYQIDFPMTAKQPVLGANAHPLYRWLYEQVGEGGSATLEFPQVSVGRGGPLSGHVAVGRRSPGLRSHRGY